MQDPNELFDVVDEFDHVTGQATRGHVHVNHLLHRAVHIFLFNSRGEFLLHLRSATKDEFPLCYTSSASGHVDAGEIYQQAAVRELGEELGLQPTVTTPLEYLGKFVASPEMAYEHTVLYRLTTDDIPQPDPGEIAEVEWVTLSELMQRMNEWPAKYTSVFQHLMRWYVERFE